MHVFTKVDNIISDSCMEGKLPSATLCIYHHSKIIHEKAYGHSDPTNKMPATVNMRYDIASLTKLFTATAFMTLVENGIFSLRERVCESIKDFTGMRNIVLMANELDINQTDSTTKGQCDAREVTWFHVLTHTSGLGWMAIYSRPDREEALREITQTMPFAYRTGSTVLYTDLGLILMGMAMENRLGIPLDELVLRQVCRPLGLDRSSYLRISTNPNPDTIGVAPTEICSWRRARIHGRVHDENAYLLDGVAGHAGMFSTARDIAMLCQDYLTAYHGGKGLLQTAAVQQMGSYQAGNGRDRRGIGWQLRIADPTSHSFPLSENAFGHTGFTGTCMWIDPKRDMCFALLTNEIYNGRTNRHIDAIRLQVTAGLVDAIDQCSVSISK